MNNSYEAASEVILQEFSTRTQEVVFAFQPSSKKLVYINDAFERVWNMSKDIIDSDFSLLLNTIHPDDLQYVTEAFDTLDNQKQKLDVQFRIVLQDVKIKWLTMCTFLINYEGINTIIGNAHDITVQKEYSDNLHKFNDKKNLVLNIVSHDLNSPLASIQTVIELVRCSAGIKDNEEVQALLKMANISCEKGITLIKDLINQEFLESSEGALNKQRIDIIANIREIINQYKQAETRLGNFYLNSFAESLFVLVDETKLMQAFNNLLSNALKFTGDITDIVVSIEDAGNNILIKISDNGIGIPENLQPFLFDKFTKARRPGIHGEPTVGLGMSIIKTIIEWHKGSIRFESKEGKGTTFFIELPKEV